MSDTDRNNEREKQNKEYNLNPLVFGVVGFILAIVGLSLTGYVLLFVGLSSIGYILLFAAAKLADKRGESYMRLGSFMLVIMLFTQYLSDVGIIQGMFGLDIRDTSLFLILLSGIFACVYSFGGLLKQRSVSRAIKKSRS